MSQQDTLLLLLFYSESIAVVETLLCVVYSVYTRRKKAAKTFGQQEIKAIALSGSSAHGDAMIAVPSHATLPHQLQLHIPSTSTADSQTHKSNNNG